MEYIFKEIEAKWQKYWEENKTYKTEIDLDKPKFYVLICSPIRQERLHVGHPLGYIASDIYSRYKRLNGFNVLHPMGYDAYGLRLSNMPYKPGSTLLLPPNKTSNAIANNWIKLDLATIGTERYAPANRLLSLDTMGFHSNVQSLL